MNRKTVSIFLIMAIPLLYIGIPAKRPQDKLTITRFEQNHPYVARPTPTPTPVPSFEPDPHIETQVKLYFFSQMEITSITIETEYLCRGYITAYCNCSKCCTYSNQPTASGVYPHYSDNPEEPTTCAIDPRYYHFGDLFMIDGKIYVAEDTGSAVKGNHWDLYREDHSEVQTFNSHYADVYRVKITTTTKSIQEVFDYGFNDDIYLRSRCLIDRFSAWNHNRKRLQG